MAGHPTTLIEAVKFFDDPQNCYDFMVNLRWPDGKPTCPHCGSTDVSWLPNAKVFKCYAKPAHERGKFSLKVGTVFEDSAIGLDKWLPVMWLLSNSRNGVSSWEIHRSVGVTQKTAWFMLQRGRLAMQDGLTGGNLAGEIEVDETFIGGKARNMHKDRKVRAMKGKRGGADGGNKTIVLGMLERASENKPKRVRATIISDRKKTSIAPEIAGNIEPGSRIMSDEFGHTWMTGMNDQYAHEA
jgi:transposase-like protein